MTSILRRDIFGLGCRTTGFWIQTCRSKSVESAENSTTDTGTSMLSKNTSLLRRLIQNRNRIKLDRQHVTVITGCDSGLGYSMAIRAWERGSTVIAGVLNPKSSGAEALSNHEAIRVLPLDIADDSSRREFTRSVEVYLKKKQSKLHALINNAGVMVFGLFEWQIEEHLVHQLTVNQLGPMLLTRKFVPLLRKHRGRLINVTSHCAKSALPGLAVYASSKAGLENWTDALRQELKSSSVPTVLFVPGSFIFETNIMARQSQYFQQMRAGMERDTRDFYGDYFEEYVKYLTPLSTEKKCDQLKDERLLGLFDGALMDTKPDAKYKCEPLRYKIYHSLFKIAPLYARDWLIQKFMAMPKFKSS